MRYRGSGRSCHAGDIYNGVKDIDETLLKMIPY